MIDRKYADKAIHYEVTLGNDGNDQDINYESAETQIETRSQSFSERISLLNFGTTTQQQINFDEIYHGSSSTYYV